MSETIDVISQATGTSTTTTASQATLSSPSVVKLHVQRADIASMARSNNDLVVTLRSGEPVTFRNFYLNNQPSQLVIEEENGALWWVEEPATSAQFKPLSSIGELTGAEAAASEGMSEQAIWTSVLGALAVGGGIAIAASNSGGGGGGHHHDEVPPPPPSELTISPDGRLVSGRAEPGSTVTVTDGKGNILGKAEVDPDGTFTITLDNPQNNGEDLRVTVTDPNGNTGPEAIVTAPDTTPPAVPSELTIAPDGRTITGYAEPGSTITVTDGSGNVLGSARAGANGFFSILLDTSFNNGEELRVTVTDPHGNTSPESVITAPDTTPPDAPTIQTITDDVGSVTGILQNGDATNDTQPTLSGTGNAGDTITVYDNGTEIGTTTVDANGNWSFTPSSPLADGDHTFTAKATDPAGNSSPDSTPITIVVDTVAPAAPTGEINADGSTITGTAEPGSTITVTDDEGKLLGSVKVGDDGHYTLTLDTPQNDGQILHITASDPVGNHSEALTLEAPDTTAPPAPEIVITDDVGSITGTLQDGDATDDTKPVLSGTGDAGDTITLYDNGTGIATITVDADGKWSFTPETDLTEGEHTFTAKATDKAGNVSEESTPITIIVDTTVPPTPVIESVLDDMGEQTGPLLDGALTDDGQPELTGTGEAGAFIIVYDNGTEIGTTTVGEDGTWSFTPAETLSDGEHALTARAVDKAGNISDPTAAITINVDTTPPPTPSISTIVDDQGGATGPLSDGQVTDDTQPTLTGTGTAGDTITLYDYGIPIGSVTVDEDGTWTYTPNNPLGEGTHQFTVSATDEAGNVSEQSAPRTIVVDTTPPLVPDISNIIDNVAPIQGPIDEDAITDDPRPELQGTGTAGDIITIYDNDSPIGSTTVEEDGSWNFTPLTPLEDGDHEFSVSATDPAGNTSEQSEPIKIVVDTSTPAAPVITAIKDGDDTLENNQPTNDTSPTLSGTGPANSTITIYDNGTDIGTTTADTNGDWTFTPASALDNGSHSFTAKATDAAGTTGPASDPMSIVVDTIQPAVPNIATVLDTAGSVTGVLADNQPTDDKRPELTGSGEPGSLVTIYLNDNAVGSVTVQPNGYWTYKLGTDLNEGNNTLYVKATDAAGNVSDPSAERTITLDTQTPSAPVLSEVADDVGDETGPITSGGTTDDSRPVLTGTGTAGDTITIYDNNAVLGTAKVDEQGNWRFQPSTPLRNGEHELSASASSPAGSEGPQSSAIIITVDTDEPDSPTITAVDDDAAPVTGNVASGGYTNDSTPKLSGTANADELITIYDNGKAIGSITADGSGAWNFTPGTPLTDGSHNFTATATDSSGSISPASNVYAVVVDTTAPNTPAITSVTGENSAEAIHNGGVTNETKPVLSGTGTAGDTITIRDSNNNVIGTATVKGDGSWSVTPETELADKTYVLTAVATDRAGNQSQPSSSVTITVDTTPPAIPTFSVIDDTAPVTGAVANGHTTNDTTPMLTGTGDKGDTITIYDNGTNIGTTTVNANGSWSFTPDAPLDNGNHSFTVKATDPAGNTSDPSAATAIVVDTSTPSQPGAPEINSAINFDSLISRAIDIRNPHPQLTGSGNTGDIITVYDGNDIIGSTTVVDGRWSFTPALALTDGDHSLSVTATNAAGVTSPPSPAIELDVNIPRGMLTFTHISDDVGPDRGFLRNEETTNDRRPTLIGTGDPGDTIRIYNGDDYLGSAYVNRSGVWRYETDALEDGTYNLYASHGQDSTPVVTITIDTTAPDKPTFNIIDDFDPVTGNVLDNGATNDRYPMLVGTGTAGDTITIYNGGREIGVTTVNSDGSWAYITPRLWNGSFTFTVTATDQAGNTSVKSDPITITVDTSAPSTPTITSVTDDVGVTTGNVEYGTETDDSTPTLNGKGVAGDIITVYDGTFVLGSTTVDSDGNWSFTPSFALSDGSHTLTAKATDAAGNVSKASGEFTFVVNTAAPDAPAITTVNDNEEPVTGNVANGGMTNDTTPTLGGNGNVGDTITIYDNGNNIGTAIVGSDGAWSFTPGTALTPGNHVFTATNTDSLGHTSNASAPYIIVVNTTVPSAPVIETVFDNNGMVQGALEEGEETDDTTPTLSGTGTAGDLITIYDNDQAIGTATVQANGTWRYTTNELTEGEHSLTAKATDPAGNVSDASKAFTFTVDTTPPAAPTITEVLDDMQPTTGAIPDNGITNDARPELTGTGTAGDYIIIYNNGEILGSTTVAEGGKWSFTPADLLPDGTYTFTAASADAAGNLSKQTDPITITIDKTPPAAPVIETVTDDVPPVTGPVADNGVTNDNKPELTGTGEAGDTITIYDNEHEIGSTTIGENGSWTFTPSEALTDGSHALTAKVTDKAGNTSNASATYTIVVDTEAPTPPGISSVLDDKEPHTEALEDNGVTNDTTPTITGSGVAGDTITIYDGETVLGTTVVGSNSIWEFNVETPLGDGKHSFTATATDAAGNTSGKSTAFNINVDTTPPDAPVITTAADNDGGSDNPSVGSDGTLNDSTPTISGTGTTGDIITLYDGDKVLGSTTVADGKWSITVAEALSDASHTLTATATDPAGNTSDKSADFILVIDTTPPDAPVIESAANDDGTHTVESGGAINDTTPVISGTGVKGDTITLYNGQNEEIGTAIVGDDGKWSITVTKALSEDSNSLTAKATDPAGNTSQPSTAFTLNVDTQAPEKPVITNATDNEEEEEVTINDNGTTNDTTPVINGTGTEGDIITLYNGETVLGSTTVGDGNTWSIELTEPLSQQKYTLTATATDPAGNVSQKSDDFTFTVDTTAPAAPVITNATGDDVSGQVDSGGDIKDTTPTINGTGGTDGDIIKLYDATDSNKLIGSTTVSGSDSWSITVDQTLSEESHTLYVTATDPAGNVSAHSNEFILTVDTTAPTAPVIDNAMPNDGGDELPVDDNGTIKDTTPVIDGTGTEGDVIRLYDASDSDKLLGSTTVSGGVKWSITIDQPLSETEHRLYATATDPAGNVSAHSTEFTLTVNTSAAALTTEIDADDPSDIAVHAASFISHLLDTAETADTDSNQPTHPWDLLPPPAPAGEVDIGDLLVSWDGEQNLPGNNLTINSDGNDTTIATSHDGAAETLSSATNFIPLENSNTTLEELVQQHHLVG